MVHHSSSFSSLLLRTSVRPNNPRKLRGTAPLLTLSNSSDTSFIRTKHLIGPSGNPLIIKLLFHRNYDLSILNLARLKTDKWRNLIRLELLDEIFFVKVLRVIGVFCNTLMRCSIECSKNNNVWLTMYNILTISYTARSKRRKINSCCPKCFTWAWKG